MPTKKNNIQYYQAVGRRKSSNAIVRLYIVSNRDKTVTVKGTNYKQGNIVINGKQIESYFASQSERNRLIKPITLTNSLDRFVISVVVKGGGKNGQLEAVIHGISKALCIVEATNRSILKKEGLLTRDSRVRERRKVGMGGKARRVKQSPKR